MVSDAGFDDCTPPSVYYSSLRRSGSSIIKLEEPDVLAAWTRTCARPGSDTVTAHALSIHHLARRATLLAPEFVRHATWPTCSISSQHAPASLATRPACLVFQEPGRSDTSLPFLSSSAKMVASSVLGFPRIGANREVKKAVEAYWAGKISAEDLTKAAADVKKTSWTSLKERGVDFIPSGEFSLYDHVLDHSAAFNVIPKRYVGQGLSPIDVYFAMGRGRQADGVDVPASEMKKWFDSNYHFVVPEVSDETEFKLNFNKAVEEFKEAKAAGVTTRPVVLGPVSFLVLSKASKEAPAGFQPISLLPKLLPVYKTLLTDLKAAGADSPLPTRPAPKIMLTTYFSRLDSNVNFVAKLPVAGLHIDLDRAPGQLDEVIAAIKPTSIVLSLGVVSGRNIWKTDFAGAIKLGQKAVDALGADRVIIATSSSLLHTPYDEFIKKEIETVVHFQEKIGLDLLVHGEPERNDMVQYFGEQLTGFVSTQNARVQSYGSRYVLPLTIVSHVSRPGPMTVCVDPTPSHAVSWVLAPRALEGGFMGESGLRGLLYDVTFAAIQVLRVQASEEADPELVKVVVRTALVCQAFTEQQLRVPNSTPSTGIP
ncbi:hypothetical protein DFH06DRAFT_1388463 [Mycena polygramma]|nr:hypothetical protein DFH06DRAFT_1388463 [Mycena polygramma]